MMPLSAWITSIAVAVVLYGGFAWCVRIAVRTSRQEQKERAGEADE